MTTALNLTILWPPYAAVESINSSRQITLPTLRQNDAIPWRVRLIQSDPSRVGSYVLTNIANLSLEMVLTDSTGATVLASNTTWIKDDALQSFDGTLIMSSAALTTAMGTSSSISGILGVKCLESGGGSWTVLDAAVTIAKPLIPAAVLTPSGGLIPLSLQEALAMFVPYVLPAGRSITLSDSTGAVKTVLRTADDGFHADNI